MNFLTQCLLIQKMEKLVIQKFVVFGLSINKKIDRKYEIYEKKI